MADPRIERLTDATPVAPLAADARAEGFRFLDRLLAEWADGTNRFAAPGEVLLGAYDGDDLVAVAGLTRQGEGTGRVRRVYVRPGARRRGIAGALMARLLAHAQGRFPVVVLFTDNPGAARFYERMGFVPERPDGPDRATHRRKP